MNVHIAITTGQPLANLIPILITKPDTIVLLTTQDMAQARQKFVKLLNSLEWTDSQIIEKELQNSNYAELLEQAIEIEEYLSQEYPDADITYNATGGTKPMAFAFMQMFANHSVIYTDMLHNQIAFLNESEHPGLALESVLSTEISLKAFGKTVRQVRSHDQGWLERVDSRKGLTYQLAKLTKDSSIFSLLNSIAQTFLSTPTKPVFIKQKFKTLTNILKRADELEVITWDPSDSSIIFHSKEAANYIAGEWLEEYTFLECQNAGFEEVLCGVQFTDDSKPASDLRNEIDVIIAHKNRMFFIECKTGQLEQKESDIIYKLDSITKQAGGTFSNALLVSAQPVDYVTKKGKRVDAGARALSHNIKSCSEEEILNLSDVLIEWKQSVG